MDFVVEVHCSILLESHVDNIDCVQLVHKDMLIRGIAIVCSIKHVDEDMVRKVSIFNIIILQLGTSHNYSHMRWLGSRNSLLKLRTSRKFQYIWRNLKL